jgi:hypothetical protein
LERDEVEVEVLTRKEGRAFPNRYLPAMRAVASRASSKLFDYLGILSIYGT